MEHGGLLRVFSFARPLRGSGHVWETYPQTCPDGRRLGFRYMQFNAETLWHFAQLSYPRVGESPE